MIDLLDRIPDHCLTVGIVAIAAALYAIGWGFRRRT